VKEERRGGKVEKAEREKRKKEDVEDERRGGKVEKGEKKSGLMLRQEEKMREESIGKKKGIEEMRK
jgi:hypothetical protein